MNKFGVNRHIQLKHITIIAFLYLISEYLYKVSKSP